MGVGGEKRDVLTRAAFDVMPQRKNFGDSRCFPGPQHRSVLANYTPTLQIVSSADSCNDFECSTVENFPTYEKYILIGLDYHASIFPLKRASSGSTP